MKVGDMINFGLYGVGPITAREGSRVYLVTPGTYGWFEEDWLAANSSLLRLGCFAGENNYFGLLLALWPYSVALDPRAKHPMHLEGWVQPPIPPPREESAREGQTEATEDKEPVQGLLFS